MKRSLLTVCFKVWVLGVTESELSSSLKSALRQDATDPQLLKQFTTHFQESKSSLYAYVFSLMPNSHAADEICQETWLYLWREFSQFEPGTNFFSWARAVAYNRVREYRSQKKRGSLVLFNQTLVEQLSLQQEEMQSELDERWQKLSNCLKKLRPQDQKLYQTYYTTKQTAETLAKKEGRSVFAIRKSIQKIRRLLFECVGRESS